MTADEKQLLAQFHHTISEQLNARLSESLKFFGLLIIVSTGYGYVLSKRELDELFVPASLLAYGAVLCASWYLAALGYAFRFLQNSQHMIEHALGWTLRRCRAQERREGQPEHLLNAHKISTIRFGSCPASIIPMHSVWRFLALISVAFCCNRWNYWLHAVIDNDCTWCNWSASF
jgi:hypothetical protein